MPEKGQKMSEEARLKMIETKKRNKKPLTEAQREALRIGWERKGYTASDEARQKMSDAKKRKVPSEACREAAAEANRNQEWTDEMRAEVSKRNAGRVRSEETKEKIRVANLGKKLSDEHKEKIRLGCQGINTYPKSEEHCRKISETLKGHKLSEETICKIVDANRGRKRTDEQKQTMSIAQTGLCKFPNGLSDEHKQKISESLSGDKNYRWRNDLTADERMDRRNLLEFQEWAKSIKQRDGYICQKCGQIGGRLTSHHICSWSQYPDKRYDLDNGICLCEKHHKEFHQIYGFACSKKDIEEYFKSDKGDTQCLL